MRSRKIRIAALIIASMPLPLTAGEPPVEDVFPVESVDISMDSLEEGIHKTDSALQAIDKLLEEQNKKYQEEALEQSLEQSQRNLERLMAEQKAREKKNNSRVWIRAIGLGVALIVLIISAIRRRRMGNS